MIKERLIMLVVGGLAKTATQREVKLASSFNTARVWATFSKTNLQVMIIHHIRLNILVENKFTTSEQSQHSQFSK